MERGTGAGEGSGGILRTVPVCCGMEGCYAVITDTEFCARLREFKLVVVAYGPSTLVRTSYSTVIGTSSTDAVRMRGAEVRSRLDRWDFLDLSEIRRFGASFVSGLGRWYPGRVAGKKLRSIGCSCVCSAKENTLLLCGGC